MIGRLLFAGIGWTDIAITLNRFAVGAFFMLSGYHKLFNPERHRSFADELKGLGVHAVGFNQWWVPLSSSLPGEPSSLGSSAPLAALGLLVVIMVAIATSGRQRMKLYKPIDEGDRIDDFLYLPETLYVFMLIMVVSARRAVQPGRGDPGFDETARRVIYGNFFDGARVQRPPLFVPDRTIELRPIGTEPELTASVTNNNALTKAAIAIAAPASAATWLPMVSWGPVTPRRRQALRW